MKSLLRCGLVAIVLSTAAVASYGQRPEPPLTNASIVKLVRAGFKEKTVIAIINNRPSHFDLGADKLIELKKSGLSDNIILAMLTQDDTFVIDNDDWSLDSTTGRRTRNVPGNQGDPESSIFGSSGGSRSSTSGRGLGNGNEQETTTTGSATVRIIKPPSEGNTPLKLEKTPTLTNEEVIKLVDAGFSEGTIIKRIEASPVDFDLSAAKLAELRRRRVTEPIIAAMMSAMSDEPSRSGPSKTKGN